jgi:lactoylglutathione lyase
MSDVCLKLLVIKTQNLESITNFYRLFNLEFVEEQHGNGPRHFSAEIGGTVFEVYPTKNADAVDSTTRLGFSVTNFAEVLDSLRSQGIEVVNEPKQTPWGLRAVVRDPDGRAVELYDS